jgi:hypothetical protein
MRALEYRPKDARGEVWMARYLDVKVDAVD